MKVSQSKRKYPGKKVTTNGNLLVSDSETLIAEAGVFYPITPSTEMGENFQNAYAKGKLNAFGKPLIAIETEGEHAAQGGAIAMSVTGKRVVNFTSGQGIVYGSEQYYHAPGKLSTMVLEVGARALTKHALNVHCGHDDVYAIMDAGWNILFAKNAQQAVDQAIILRRVNELSLNPGINVQDGFLTTHLERTFLEPEPGLIREFLGDSDDIIQCPTDAQKVLFGDTRKRVPAMLDLKNPILLGPVQNQEHYMNGVAARRNNFSESILGFFEEAYEEFGNLTGRYYNLVSQYNCEDAEVVFISLGSSSENIEAASDYLLKTRNEKVGVIHINVVRTFPEKALINAIKGKKKVIILERTDEPLSVDNPLTRDVKTTIEKAVSNFIDGRKDDCPKMDPGKERPKIYSGVYGLGSRDFRPESIIGAYDYALNRIARQDGKKCSDGVCFFYLGIDHPYAVNSEEKPSLLPEKSIAIRFHSIGGWGMITTGKNLGMILGEFSEYIAKRDNLKDEDGNYKDLIHISANPKYGSEKKGAPTNYFLVAAPERIRVNCDLRHVNVVLCCDPKIFLHTNPLTGLEENGAFVWESNETTSEKAWERIPVKYRKEIIDKKIRVYILNGFEIAKEATDRIDLQTRMQGNSFLGAFFKVSSFLKDYNIPEKEFLSTVKEQYEKKFGRFGKAVVESNMTVMQKGFKQVHKVPVLDINAVDKSDFTGEVLSCHEISSHNNLSSIEKAPLFRMSTFDKEFRAGLGYDQPASPLASVGMLASGTGFNASKYVARREIPFFIAENCTQCMDCITVCPDTALPNTAQDISTILEKVIKHYVSGKDAIRELLAKLPELEKNVRAEMLLFASDRDSKVSFAEVVSNQITKIKNDNITDGVIKEITSVLSHLPFAYLKTKAIFSGREKKEAGSGGLFGIFVSDLCKGCSACVEACGSHEALKMVPETEDIHAKNLSASAFLDLLSDTAVKYLGIFDAENPEETKAAALKFHLMLRSKYTALVAGDGACAGCGEKSALRSAVTVTEMFMRTVFRKKADRLQKKTEKLKENGLEILQKVKKEDDKSYKAFQQTVLHILMRYGRETEEVTEAEIAENFNGSEADILNVIVNALLVDASNHSELHAFEGHAPNGMSVMAMTANTGCNTVYGSTPPNNPHPYPWMNSLFQDGSTIGWLVGESFIRDHAATSVIPERLADVILGNFENGFSADDYFRFTHFTDTYMTDQEIIELPKVWVTGGDGGMGDIGFQNMSKVVLQNRPNIKMMMLDTQVYSNTGGQNSDSSPMTGGFDMNQYGTGSEGKLTEMKSVAESFLGGHGSPYIAQVSMSNAGTLYKSMLDALTYRGTAYFQVYTTCQPEHGVPDYASQIQALRARDSRGMPEFVYDPRLGESYQEILKISGNPSFKRDWAEKIAPVIKQKYTYTVAHWAFSEPRFRFHNKIIVQEDTNGMIRLEDKLQLILMNDITNRKYIDKGHRSYIPDFGVYAIDFNEEGKAVYHALSRQMVIFCVERRKAWRMLQSRAGVINEDYKTQQELLGKIDKGELSVEDFYREISVKELS